MERAGMQNLVIDLRTNGGGNVTNSNLLTKYIAAQPFRIADSLYTRTRTSRYARYQQHHLLNSLFAFFMTRRGRDGNYHFGYYERKQFAPKKKHHFDGSVYVLSGGNTFSASTLFIKSLIGQANVTLVGEETGGGAYGNNAWLIPNVTLPRTGVRFRLPLYRLVIDRNERKGFGVQPEIIAVPTVEAIRKNRDLKLAAALESIRASR
jgi:C-terminal processing protease CtpA/Prc